MRSKEKSNYIHIFAGCGGLSLGLYKAGWRGVFAIEKNEMAFETLKFNLIDNKNHFDWPSWLPIKAYDINYFIKKYNKNITKLKGKITLVAGGPPCQGFSSAGQRREEDERNKLVDSYINFVKILSPEAVFFENVKGFTEQFKKRASFGKIYSKYVSDELEKIGYNIDYEVINFGDYGIPQRRKRFILVGFQKHEPELFFKKLKENKPTFLKSKNINEYISVKEAISDLECKNGKYISKENNRFYEGKYGNIENNYQSLLRKESRLINPDSHRFANHQKDTIDKFKYILKNCVKDTDIGLETKKLFNMKKHHVVALDGGSRSPSLTTLPDDYIHYSEPRILTVREYARIQSFDDNFKFKGKYTTGGDRRLVEVPRYTQIGNAIPPLFMEQAGIILGRLL